MPKTPFAFTIGQQYTRDDISRIIGKDETSGGDWFTGHPRFKDEFFVFANIKSRDEQDTTITMSGLTAN